MSILQVIREGLRRRALFSDLRKLSPAQLRDIGIEPGREAEVATEMAKGRVERRGGDRVAKPQPVIKGQARLECC